MPVQSAKLNAHISISVSMYVYIAESRLSARNEGETYEVKDKVYGETLPQGIQHVPEKVPQSVELNKSQSQRTPCSVFLALYLTRTVQSSDQRCTILVPYWHSVFHSTESATVGGE